ncbi:MAG TPA: Rrf2 family transcriptional regulator [Ignavibacteria bacterium]
MNLSKTSQYALKVLNHMAVNDENQFSAKTLHNKLKIPYPYLRRLLTKLSNNKLLKSTKGRCGGYVFAKKMESIYLSDILTATDEPEILSTCAFGLDKCLIAEKCAIHDRWIEAKEKILEVLQTTNLKDLRNNTKHQSLLNKKQKN